MQLDNICPSMVHFPGVSQSDSLSPEEERDKLKTVLGLDKFTRCEPRWEIKSRTVLEEYILYDMTIMTEPGIVMPFFALTPPDDDLLAHPLVIVPHGHGSDGRFGAAGINRHRDMVRQQEKFNHDLGVQFVRQGYTALCPDARGAGDRRNKEDQGDEFEKLKSSSCTNLNNAFILLGTSLAAAWCWDLMALTDLVLEKKWGNSKGIGVCGFSGGGAQALLLSALDDRIAVTGVSGYFYQYADSLLHSNLCSCNFIPRFADHYNMAALGTLIAPRPLIIEKGTEDPLNGIRGIEGPSELVSSVKKTYENLSCGDNFSFSPINGVHRFSGRDIFPFFDRYLKE